jgi:hypothetical protein
VTTTVHGDKLGRFIHPNHAKLEKPPTLCVALLTKSAARDWQRRADAAGAIDDAEKRDATYDALLGEIVKGWENIEGPLDIKKLSEVYTLPEFIDVVNSIVFAMTLSPEDRKK